MSSTSAVYVKVSDGIVSGRGIRNLCQRLTEKGYGVDGEEFKVYNFYDDSHVSTIKRNTLSGVWVRLIPEHWQFCYEPKNNAYALNKKYEGDVQN